MEAILPGELFREIITWLISDNQMSSKQLARGVCKAWDAFINFSDLEIHRKIDAHAATQLRDILLKKSGSFGLSIRNISVDDAIVLLEHLSHLTSLVYKAKIAVLRQVTNLQKLAAFVVPSEWLLKQSNLTSLDASVIEGRSLPTLTLTNLQSLAYAGIEVGSVLKACSPTQLTFLDTSLSTSFDLVEYRNLKSIMLRTAPGLNMNFDLPNLESLSLNHLTGHITAPLLTKLRINAPNNRVVGVLPGLTALRDLFCKWSTSDADTSVFTALTNLEQLMVSNVPTAQVLQHICADHLTHLSMAPQSSSAEEVQHLARLTALRRLDLRAPFALDASVLAPLTRIEVLRLGGACSNLSAFAALGRLCSLELIEAPTELSLSCTAISGLTWLQIQAYNTSVTVTDWTALQRLKFLSTSTEIDLDQLNTAHLTSLIATKHNGTLWRNLTRMPELQYIVTHDISCDEHVIALSVLTRLTCFSAAFCSSDGRELTRLTTLQYLQYITLEGSQEIKVELQQKLSHLMQLTYVVKN